MSDIRKVKREKVTIELDKERELKYTLDSFSELELKYGSIQAAFEQLDKERITDIIFFLWAGLMHEDENLTVKQIGKMIDVHDLEYVMQKVNEVMEVDSPKASKESNPN